MKKERLSLFMLVICAFRGDVMKKIIGMKILQYNIIIIQIVDKS
jgi:hypothetical protein